MHRIIRTPRTSPHGFTAVEIAMVASVIAILALLILPMFRNRSEEAKSVAARDELQSLAKALLLAQADTGRYFRLQDLDNGLASALDRPDINVPITDAFDTLTENQRFQLVQPSGAVQLGASYWRGPYISFQKSITLGQLLAARPYLFRNQAQPAIPFQGPIWSAHSTSGTGFPKSGNVYGAVFDPNADRIPVDPWGSPYLFIAETQYGGHRMLFSMGPNGIPGNTTTPTDPTRYYPPPVGELGTGDDIQYIF